MLDAERRPRVVEDRLTPRRSTQTLSPFVALQEGHSTVP